MKVSTILLAALVLALAGCSGDDDGGGGGGQAAESSGFPVTIEHKFGTTEVPGKPQRVVNVGYTEQDALLALGVKPAGTREFLGGYDWKSRPWAQKALAGADLPVVGSEEINFEAVAAKRPDLIVGLNSGMTRGDYERLSKIAPTLPQSGDFIDYGMPWDAQTEMIGKALGRDDAAAKVVAGVKAKFTAARRAHPEIVGRTAVLAYGGPDGYGAYSSQDTRSRFFADLGLKTPPKIDELAGKSFYTELSQERFRLLDQDLVVMFGTQADVLADPVFRRLKAVKEDRVIYLDLGDRFAGALGFSSALSLPYLVDEAVPKISAALDGDPMTKVEQPQ